MMIDQKDAGWIALVLVIVVLVITLFSNRQSSDLMITTTSPLPNAIVSVDYSEKLAATGSVGQTEWQWEGKKPPGLSLDAQTGIISGTPTSEGEFRFVVRATDSGRPSSSDTKELQLNVKSLSALEITTTSPLPLVIINQPFPSIRLKSIGGIPPVSWTADQLHPGFVLDPSSGKFGLTDDASGGVFKFDITVNDSVDQCDSKSFTLYVAEQKLSITTDPVLEDAKVGQDPEFRDLSVKGGVPPFLWSLSDLPDGLPDDFTLNHETGQLTFTPSSAGNFKFNIKVEDRAKQADSKRFTLTISDAVVITTGSLPSGKNGDPYSIQLEAENGREPLTWFIESGDLPEGLELSRQGQLTGTPLETGTFDVEIGVADSLGTRDAKAYQITIIGGREIIINGVAPTNWEIIVDDEIVVTGPSVDVAVTPGDTIEWRFKSGFQHGVTFPDFTAAQDFLEFDTTVGDEIKPQPDFGPDAQGTDPTSAAGTMLRAIIRDQAGASPIRFICTFHGPGMAGELIR